MREPDYASSEAERCNGTKTRPTVLSIGFSVWQDLGYATKSALGTPSIIIREREGFPEVILPCSLCEEGAPLSLSIYWCRWSLSDEFTLHPQSFRSDEFHPKETATQLPSAMSCFGSGFSNSKNIHNSEMGVPLLTEEVRR